MRCYDIDWLFGVVFDDLLRSLLSVRVSRPHSALTYWTLSRMQQLWRFVWPVNKTASTFHICWTCHPRASTIKFLHVIPTTHHHQEQWDFMYKHAISVSIHTQKEEIELAHTCEPETSTSQSITNRECNCSRSRDKRIELLSGETQGTSITLRMMRAWIFESVTCAWSWAHYVWGLVTVGLLPRRSDPPASWHDLGQTSTDTYDLISVLPCIPSRNPWFAHEPERRAFDTSQLWCQWLWRKNVYTVTSPFEKECHARHILIPPTISVPHETRTYDKTRLRAAQK